MFSLVEFRDLADLRVGVQTFPSSLFYFYLFDAALTFRFLGIYLRFK